MVKWKSLTKFARYSWGVLAYNLLVIAWGVYVRASGSGAGCGEHWPLCNGVVVPRAPQVETIIEFTHRVTSGLTVLLVAGLVIWAWRRYPRRSPIRTSAALVGFFTLTEALIGAWLVLAGLVGQNESLTRAYSMIAHLANTFLLIGTIALTAWWASDHLPEGFAWHGGLSALLLVGLVSMIVLGASGAIAALGDTLFPASSLAEGLRQDANAEAHILIRLRIIHPMLAAGTGLALGALAYTLRRKYADARVQFFSALLIGVIVLQWMLGIINVALLAPIPIQIIHLLVSDLMWLALVLLTVTVLGSPHLLPRLANQQVHDRIDQPKSVG